MPAGAADVVREPAPRPLAAAPVRVRARPAELRDRRRPGHRARERRARLPRGGPRRRRLRLRARRPEGLTGAAPRRRLLVERRRRQVRAGVPGRGSPGRRGRHGRRERGGARDGGRRVDLGRRARLAQIRVERSPGLPLPRGGAARGALRVRRRAPRLRRLGPGRARGPRQSRVADAAGTVRPRDPIESPSDRSPAGGAPRPRAGSAEGAVARVRPGYFPEDRRGVYKRRGVHGDRRAAAAPRPVPREGRGARRPRPRDRVLPRLGRRGLRGPAARGVRRRRLGAFARRARGARLRPRRRRGLPAHRRGEVVDAAAEDAARRLPGGALPRVAGRRRGRARRRRVRRRLRGAGARERGARALHAGPARRARRGRAVLRGPRRRGVAVGRRRGLCDDAAAADDVPRAARHARRRLRGAGRVDLRDGRRPRGRARRPHRPVGEPRPHPPAAAARRAAAAALLADDGRGRAPVHDPRRPGRPGHVGPAGRRPRLPAELAGRHPGGPAGHAGRAGGGARRFIGGRARRGDGVEGRGDPARRRPRGGPRVRDAARDSQKRAQRGHQTCCDPGIPLSCCARARAAPPGRPCRAR